MSFRHLLEAKDMQLVTPPQSVKTMSAILPAVHAPSTPGTHALFTGSDDPLVLSRIADDVAHHPGNVWLPIISLHREDAARLGYDDAERWCTFLSGYAMEMARAMKIPWEQFRWYAAFHDEAHHPHVHMVCYSADGKSGYLTKDGIAQIKSGLVKQIFRQEPHELYEQQTQRRDELAQEAGAVLAELSAFACATQLLHHLGRLFQDRTQRAPIRGIAITDRKLRRRIQEKKIAMGHKADDHEDAGITMQ